MQSLLSRFPQGGLADTGGPDPLDLDAARPARAVSRMALGGPRRAQTCASSGERVGEPRSPGIWARCHFVAIVMGARGLSRALKGFRTITGAEGSSLRGAPLPTRFSRAYGDSARRIRVRLPSALSRPKRGFKSRWSHHLLL